MIMTVRKITVFAYHEKDDEKDDDDSAFLSHDNLQMLTASCRSVHSLTRPTSPPPPLRGTLLA